MRRLECLQAIYEDLQDCAVVTIMGATSAELHSLGHRPNFFYLTHAMGLASSIGLGLALCQPERQVVVLDGDGSVLMNLGGLTTMARYGVTVPFYFHEYTRNGALGDAAANASLAYGTALMESALHNFVSFTE